MKKGLLILMISLVTYLSGLAQSTDLTSLKLDWEYYELENGLQVLLQPDSSRKDISIEFWVHSGGSDEKSDQYGLAHFFEHATPYGLQGDAEEEKLNKLLENMNNSNAQTRPDFTRYYIQINPEVLELGMRYASDRLKADTSAITEKLVEWHRGNVLNEYDRQTRHPLWGGVQRMVRSAGTFGEYHPYGHSGYGMRENNENFTVRDFRKWYAEHIFAENMTLYVVGNFDIKNTKELIASNFDDIHQNGITKPAWEGTPNQKAGKKTVKASTENHTLIMSWAVPEWGSEDDPALHLVSTILNERLSNTDAWEQSVTDAGATASLYKMAGEFYVHATFSDLSDSTHVERWLNQNLEEIIEKGVPGDELVQAVNSEVSKVENAMNNERLGFYSSRTELLGEGLLFTGRPDYYLTRLEQQGNLSETDIQHVAKKQLGIEPFRLLIIATNQDD